MKSPPLLLAAAVIHLMPAAASAQRSDVVVTAPLRPWQAPPVADPVLDAARGGIALPNGVAVSIGIDIQTRVNGVLVLHSIYASDGPSTGVRVFTDGTAPVRLAPDTQTVRTPGVSGATTVQMGDTPTGVVITPGTAVAPATVNLVSGPSSIWVGAEGQMEIPVTPNGPAVTSPPGAVTLRSDELGSVVTLDASTLQVRHLIGQATGVIVGNTANDRVIDTVSSVNVDLQGANLPLLGSLLTADSLAANLFRGR